jgi:hypothetical protein
VVPRGSRVKLVDGLAAPVYLDLDADAAPGRTFPLLGSFSSGVAPLRGMNNWSVIAATGAAVGQVATPSGLAVDMVGNLYVADTDNNRVQEYAPGGAQ